MQQASAQLNGTFSEMEDFLIRVAAQSGSCLNIGPEQAKVLSLFSVTFPETEISLSGKL